ncbi:glutamic acid-rich protein-like [Trichogramma pretiosum]|uniref:glutamic acid-rich protein-like n=1 Tax=Trichogramma pretiosum TaxID=7493 RepID=UPI0006C94083|nr:glutamic acid-rich protein-like [Trichogramma pretiosum]
MAPIKRGGLDSNNRSDKSKRHRRADDTSMLYKCIGQLCGEECDREIVHVNEGSSGGSNRRNHTSGKHQRGNEAMDMDAIDDAMLSDEEYDEDYREPAPRPSNQSAQQTTKPAGRVQKPKARKAPPIADMPLKIGVQKAKRYICEALDFGVQSGFLVPKDKGRILQVSSDLLNSSADPNKLRALNRIGGEASGALQRKRTQEMRDDDAEADRVQRRKMRKGGRSHRSRSRKHRSKRGMKSSRSRSKRRHGRKRASHRSRSANAEGVDPISKRGEKSVEQQQDEIDADSKESNANKSATNEDQDNSQNTSSTTPGQSQVTNYDSQTTNDEDKTKQPDDDEDDDDEDEDEDEKKK